MGIANASAALDAGARVLDGSLGGLGGCPFAPGATGNVVFEDLVFLCESKGFATGIDIEKLIAVRAILKSEMPDETLYGGVARAGLPSGTRPRRRDSLPSGRACPGRGGPSGYLPKNVDARDIERRPPSERICPMRSDLPRKRER